MAYKDPEERRAKRRESQRAWLAKNPDYHREWRAKNPEKMAAHCVRQAENRRKWQEKQPEDYTRTRHRKEHSRKRQEQAGRPRPEFCEACGRPPDPQKALHFDHCHKGGHFRGWLCNNCNVMLGLVHDDPIRLLKLAAYLKRTALKNSPQIPLPGM